MSRFLHVSLLAFFFVLPLAAQSASFTGVVRNSAGAALGDMTVEAYNPAGFPVGASTDSQGRYLLIVPPGTYRVVAYDNSGTYAVSFFADAQAFELSPAINVIEGQQVTANFVLPAGRSISGFVVDGSSGAPLAGAVVAAYNLDGTRRTFVATNADGSYTLTVPQASFKIVAYHEVAAFVPRFYQNQDLFEDATVVTPPASNVTFGLGRGTKLLGSVREKLSDVPLPGLPVVAYDLQGIRRFRTETNPAGTFTFVLPPGAYKFAVEDPAGNYQTTFYRDTTTFESAATIVADSSAPLLQFSISRIADGAPATTLFIPGIIHSQNVGNGTFFKTDVWVQNSAATPLTVMGTFLRAGEDNTVAQGVPVTIPARGQVFLKDIVAGFFGTTGAGALRLEADTPFRATSRTYNVPANSAQIGTFGLSIPAQPIGATLGRATLTGLVQGAESRTNIGLMNPHSFPVAVTFELFSASGGLLGSRTLELRPLEWVQPSVENLLGTSTFEQAYAVVSSTNGSFFSYAAVVDAKSGDGTFILPSSD